MTKWFSRTISFLFIGQSQKYLYNIRFSPSNVRTTSPEKINPLALMHRGPHCVKVVSGNPFSYRREHIYIYISVFIITNGYSEK